MSVISGKVVCVQRISSGEVTSLRWKIPFVESVVTQLCKIADEIFGIDIHRKFRFLEEEIFVFEILDSCSEPKPKVFIPYIRKSKLTGMIFVSSVIGTVTMIVNVDVIVLEHVRKVDVSLLHRLQCIVYPCHVSFAQSPGDGDFGGNMSL